MQYFPKTTPASTCFFEWWAAIEERSQYAQTVRVVLLQLRGSTLRWGLSRFLRACARRRGRPAWRRRRARLRLISWSNTEIAEESRLEWPETIDWVSIKITRLVQITGHGEVTGQIQRCKKPYDILCNEGDYLGSQYHPLFKEGLYSWTRYAHLPDFRRIPSDWDCFY